MSERVKKEIFIQVKSLELEKVELFLEESNEFKKLDDIDRLSTAWIVQNTPKRLMSVIEYYHEQYKKISVILDTEKFYYEVDQIMTIMKWK